VNAFEIGAVIIGIFFAVGIGVGLLIMVSIPAIARITHRDSELERHLREYHPDPRDQPDPGPTPGTQPLPRVPPPREPDDRDDYPWWPGLR
jgi:hypothetical protein